MKALIGVLSKNKQYEKTDFPQPFGNIVFSGFLRQGE